MTSFEDRMDDEHSSYEAQVEFQASRTVLPAAQRVTWRLSILVLILAKFRGGTASLGTLHLFLWGFRTSVARSLLRSWLTGANQPDLVTSRIDPNLETTLGLATAEGLVIVTSTGRVALTDRGQELAAILDAADDVLEAEKDLLRTVAPLSDASVHSRMNGVANDA